jgi:carbon storage regulator
MLVLSRKKDERIFITLGEQTVAVRILHVDGNKVRLGVEAPDDVAIHREEIYHRRAEFTAEPKASVTGRS